MDTAIIAKFGGDTTDLKSATTEAEIIVKGFGTAAGRAVGEIGRGFGGAVAIMESVKAIKELGGAAIEAAEKERVAFNTTGAAIDEQAQAWLDLKDGWSDAAGGVKGYVTAFLSSFPMMGSAIGGFINTLRGISPEAQKQFEDMANSYGATMASISARYDKFVAELPAKLGAAGTRLAELTAQIEASQESNQAKVANLYATQFSIVDSIASTKKVIEAQDAAGVDTAATTLVLLQQEGDLEKNRLQIQQAQVAGARDYITSVTLSFAAKKSTLTIEEQIAALTRQQASFEKDAADASGNAKAQQEYKNAASRVGVEIAKDEETVRRATALSEADVLAQYISQNSQLSGLNVLSGNQLSLLQQQSAEKKNQYAIDQLLQKGVENLTKAESDRLTALVQQGVQLKLNLDLINQAISAENTPSVPNGSGGKLRLPNGRVIDLGGDAPNITTQILDVNGNPTGKWNTEAGSGSGGGFSGPGFMTDPRFNPGTVGAGFGNQQLQDQFTSRNNQSFVNSQIADLQSRIQGFENSDIKANEDMVPMLQKQLALLQRIHDGVVPVLTGAR